jgi:dienelactone hydrolase
MTAMRATIALGVLLLHLLWPGWRATAEPARALAFRARSLAEARPWQQAARAKLISLMMGGSEPGRGPLEPRVLKRSEVVPGGYALEELTLQTLPDRRAHVWLATPLVSRGRVGAVLALHGHGGSGEEIVRGLSLYWYGRALAEMGYVVISPDIGQHELQHTNWTLMGERTWDALRCVDYLCTRPEVDTQRLAVCGLSLGGETTMYVAALDERLRAVCASGWLTTVANMKQGHCPCWNFPGLEEHFDFADVFACIAPRPLVCELGEKERAPGGFPVETGRRGFGEIRAAYRVFGAEQRAMLTVHPAGHVFNGRDFWPQVHRALGQPFPWSGLAGTARPAATASNSARSATARETDELLRRGELARRSFCRALGVLDGWWQTREPRTGLYPRRLDQPVWAPNDNAADMLPFLALTAHYLAPARLEEVLRIIPLERELTTRWEGLPDWFALTNRAWVYPQVDTNRLVFCAAEYCKDGLLPMTEVMGRGLWTERLFALVEAMFAHAPQASDFGSLPADDTEVNGETLQVLSRLYFLTGERKFLDWAQRIGDAYCFEVLPRSGYLPPARWDFQNHRALADRFSLNDHGNEIVGGLSELYVAAQAGAPDKAARYRAPLKAMSARLLDRARNADGLWVELVRPSDGGVIDARTPDTWGYALSGVATLSLAMRDSVGARAARKALRHLDQGRYLDWAGGADSYADSIEGGLVLLNRFPAKAGWSWFGKVLPVFLGKQREDGIVEGWYGDGNYARTALMAGLYYTQGARCHPWRTDLRLGAIRRGGRLLLALQAKEAWSGRVLFDRPRHRLHLGLPFNYPRLNEFPEWYAVDPAATYEVRLGAEAPRRRTGAQLADGVFLSLGTGQTATLQVRRE